MDREMTTQEFADAVATAMGEGWTARIVPRWGTVDVHVEHADGYWFVFGAPDVGVVKPSPPYKSYIRPYLPAAVSGFAPRRYEYVNGRDEIGVTISRGPEVVAAEVKRRLLPSLLSDYRQAVESRRRHDAELAETHAAADKLASAFGLGDWTEMAERGYGHLGLSDEELRRDNNPALGGRVYVDDGRPKGAIVDRNVVAMDTRDDRSAVIFEAKPSWRGETAEIRIQYLPIEAATRVLATLAALGEVESTHAWRERQEEREREARERRRAAAEATEARRADPETIEVVILNGDGMHEGTIKP